MRFLLLCLLSFSTSISAQNTSTGLYCSLNGGLSQTTGGYSTTSADYFLGGAMNGFSANFNVGGNIFKEWRWHINIGYSQHQQRTDDMYAIRSDIKTIGVTGIFDNKSIGGGVSYFFPVTKISRSGFYLAGLVHLWTNSIPNLHIFIDPKGYATKTIQRTDGNGFGAGYSISLGYQQHFSPSKVFVFVQGRLSNGHLQTTTTYSETYEREPVIPQKLSLIQHYNTLDLHLGLGYFLK